MKAATLRKINAHFGELVGTASHQLYRLALRITHNQEDAKEVVQQTWLKAYRKLYQFEGRSTFASWVYRIAINQALMLLRKRRAHVPFEVALSEAESRWAEILPSETAGPEEVCYRRELNYQLTKAIGNLCPAYQVVFRMRLLEQVPNHEVATQLRISDNCVKSRLRRAKAQLRQQLTAVRTLRRAPPGKGV